MKKIYTLTLVCIFAIQAYAQSPAMTILSKKDHSDITNGTYTIYGDAARYVITEEFLSIMTGVDSVLYGATRREIDTVTGMEDYYCWKECYAPKPAGTQPVWIATDSLMLHQNDTVHNFSVYLNPKGYLGSPKYRYIFTPKGFPSDTTFVDITFDILTIGLDVHNQLDIQVYPNPASDVLVISLNDVEAQGTWARILSTSGQVASTYRLNSTNRLDVSDLQRGLYIVEVIRNGATLGRKKLMLE